MVASTTCGTIYWKRPVYAVFRCQGFPITHRYDIAQRPHLPPLRNPPQIAIDKLAVLERLIVHKPALEDRLRHLLQLFDDAVVQLDLVIEAGQRSGDLALFGYTWGPYAIV